MNREPVGQLDGPGVRKNHHWRPALVSAWTSAQDFGESGRVVDDVGVGCTGSTNAMTRWQSRTASE
jgi:hypothetical protein